MSPLVAHERRPVSLRHIRPALAGDTGAQAILGYYLRPDDVRGVNGPGGWVSGSIEARMLEEGKLELVFPNGVGGDDVEHLKRFAILTVPGYQPGDEWLEVWEGDRPGLAPAPLFVGTPTDVPRVSELAIELAGGDPLELLKTVRETAAGFWVHAPRDVFDHYTGAWEVLQAEPFDTGGYIFDSVPATHAATGIVYQRADDVVAGELRLTAATTGDVAYIELPDLLRPGGGAGVAGAPPPAWRIDVVFTRTILLANLLRLSIGTAPDPRIEVDFGDLTIAARTIDVATFGTSERGVPNRAEAPGAYSVAIEARDRWVFVYVNGDLLVTLPRPYSAGVEAKPRLELATLSPAAGADVNVRSYLARHHRDFGLRGLAGLERGDLRLPGAPQAGGLIGAYFNDADLRALPDAEALARTLAPGREPVARRLDATIDSPTIPLNVPAEHYAVRWTGAIYLDLAASSRYLRIRDLDDAACLWVAKTRPGEHLLRDWATGAARTTAASADLRAHLGVQTSGWYPIRLEYVNRTAGDSIVLEEATSAGGPWTTVPSSRLSPQGIFEQHVRHGSHYEQLDALGKTVGLQWRVDPQSFESGKFPASIVPRVRVGRDTDKRITVEDLAGGTPERSLGARDVVAALLLEAAGLARDDGAQLTLEQLDFAELGRHLLLHTDAVSLADITIPAVLELRGRTLQALRTRAVEDVAFRPRGSTELVDTFPLTGVLSLLRWQPGDGARLDFPRIAVADALARQMTAVRHGIVPQALGPPEVSWRPRPRSARAQLRELARAFGRARRTDQGQLGPVNGNNAASPATADFPASASRANYRGDRLVEAFVIVQAKSDASSWPLRLNGVPAGIAVQAPGAYEVTAWASKEGANERIVADFGAGGTGTIEFALELTVRV